MLYPFDGFSLERDVKKSVIFWVSTDRKGKYSMVEMAGLG